MERKQCTMCCNASTELCKICNSSAYCSPECQKADMPIHQLLCAELQNFSTPPNASAKRGIYFPVDENVPKFVWVTTEWIPADEYESGYEKLKLEPFIGDVISDTMRIYANCIRSRARRDQLHVKVRDTCLIDGSKRNRSIAELTSGFIPFYTWCGGVVAVKLPSLHQDPDRYVHMDMVDFRDVVDLFRSYRSDNRISDMSLNKNHRGPVSPLEEMLKQRDGKQQTKATSSTASKKSNKPPDVGMKKTAAALPSSKMSAIRLVPGPVEGAKFKMGDKKKAQVESSTSLEDLVNSINMGKKPNLKKHTKKPSPKKDADLPGVRINCEGDQRLNGRAKFEPITVSPSDPVWNEPCPEIPKLVGIPIRVACISPDDPLPTGFNSSNQAATFLHMNPDPNASNWGWATPMTWLIGAPGSVLVVHADRKAILPQDVEALCYYCQYVLQPLFEISLDPKPPYSKSDVLRRLTPLEYQLFHQGFANWKRDNTPNTI